MATDSMIVKVAHVNLGDSARYGGTAVAVSRLNQALQQAGIDSRVLCGFLDQEQPGYNLLPRPMLLRLLEAIVKRITREFGLNDVHSFSSFLLKRSPLIAKADILNLHCIHHGYFNYLSLPYLTAQKPTIYTMHDMWSFTGHCTYSFQCDRWRTGCGKCPDLTIVPAVKRDATQIEWKLKKWAYEHSNLSIVSPSLWMADLLRNSILNCCSIEHIPNGIDTNLYRPVDTEESRSLLGIQAGKKVLMFGAAYLDDPRKGFDLLVSALESLPNELKTEMVLLIFGTGSEDIAQTVGITTINLGYVTSDQQKAIAYSAADLFIFPTRADNLPIVLQESMACGTPIVSFNVGGVPELVRPGVTGYLAKPEDCNDFRNGIIELLEDEELRCKMAFNCREIAVNEYSLDLQAKRYIGLYKKIYATLRL
jgi:glycosyltransferase involved in cell wall biosynthesis